MEEGNFYNINKKNLKNHSGVELQDYTLIFMT